MCASKHLFGRRGGLEQGRIAVEMPQSSPPPRTSDRPRAEKCFKRRFVRGRQNGWGRATGGRYLPPLGCSGALVGPSGPEHRRRSAPQPSSGAALGFGAARTVVRWLGGRALPAARCRRVRRARHRMSRRGMKRAAAAGSASGADGWEHRIVGGRVRRSSSSSRWSTSTRQTGSCSYPKAFRASTDPIRP